MAHDKDRISGIENLLERLRLDSRLDTRTLFHLPALSAVVGDVLRVLDDGLIAATAKRQINGVSREFIILRIGESVQTDSYTQCDGHFITDLDCFGILEQIEVILLQLP